MSCGVGCRRGSDLVLLWLWRRPVATAPIQPLAWEPPYAVGMALEKTKKKEVRLFQSGPDVELQLDNSSDVQRAINCSSLTETTGE